MISSVEELLSLVDALKARGVCQFKLGDIELTLLLPQPKVVDLDDFEVEQPDSGEKQASYEEMLFWSTS